MSLPELLLAFRFARKRAISAQIYSQVFWETGEKELPCKETKTQGAQKATKCTQQTNQSKPSNAAEKTDAFVAM